MRNKAIYFKTDIQAGVVVFLVALPLCLGIALASGAPLFAGIISGVIGGIVVGALSKSQLSVSGPAAGLTAIVLAAISSLGSYETFLMAVVLAGVFQVILGLVKAGTISNYFPSNVIEGMLTAIGIIIILKQLPHAIGYDVDNEGDFFFIETKTGHNTFSAIVDAVNYSHLGAITITLVSLAILIAFTKVDFLKKLKVVPGALVAVVAGVVLNEVFKASGSSLAISQEHLVNLPMPKSFNDFIGQFSTPDFSSIAKPEVWIVALTIAAVASIETLLCIEAADKLDPLKRYTNSNAELLAQGTGNMLSGLIGGIPMTSVIVRTSANINSGGRTKTATISHGILLLIAVLAIPSVLNKIPLACLAAILLMIGYKLASPKVFMHMWKSGKYQVIPFIVTVVAVVFTDLLEGVAIGLVVSIFFILRANLKLAYFFKREEYHEGEVINIKLAQEVSFLNKAAIKQTLNHLPAGSKVVIDASDTFYIDHDVVQLIRDFLAIGSKDKDIELTLVGFKDDYKMEFSNHVSSN
ncbi:MAG TPA: SulP family inorganic anion transporter [Haliscomenobacter sp.]|uniref:Sulphate transporter n=1 Tax=Haliscomenobacter hydrossis (strain ATCC 27775 / DSM 1100 / LMG 10767 / O) TaxID=760192 RepID=F4KRX5_HALH1|nr:MULTISPECIES: SulP family inorganic anion transporter [Haliscomenobacter]AEE51062.1 sulphate transporter [Haliscomenobacter hydrossis DSM 1100]HOY20749.1 SulP family inorganic anion transporter [Haliscomenobacter sp.]